MGLLHSLPWTLSSHSYFMLQEATARPRGCCCKQIRKGRCSPLLLNTLKKPATRHSSWHARKAGHEFCKAEDKTRNASGLGCQRGGGEDYKKPVTLPLSAFAGSFCVSVSAIQQIEPRIKAWDCARAPSWASAVLTAISNRHGVIVGISGWQCEVTSFMGKLGIRDARQVSLSFFFLLFFLVLQKPHPWVAATSIAVKANSPPLIIPKRLNKIGKKNIFFFSQCFRIPAVF